MIFFVVAKHIFHSFVGNYTLTPDVCNAYVNKNWLPQWTSYHPVGCRVCRFLNFCCNFLRCTFVIGSKCSALIQIWGPPVDPSSSVTPTRSVLNSDPNKYRRWLRSNLFFNPNYYRLVEIYGMSLIYLLYLRLAKIWQLASDWQFGVLWSTQNGRIKLILQEEIC